VGTDLPLLVGLIVSCGLDAASVLSVFGALQIATGIRYGIPMPVQPLKAMAAIMIAQRLPPSTLAGAGIAIGIAMLVLAVSGLLDVLAKSVPRGVVRGIQLGLGVSLATLALRDYAGKDGAPGYVLAGLCVAALLVLRKQKRFPAPLIVIGMGCLYGVLIHVIPAQGGPIFEFHLPSFQMPSRNDLLDGALLLALPQIPLSLGNSVVATSQTTRDLFPERPVSVRQIGVTFGLMNLIGPLFGCVPTCHGCGGLVGFYGFGARTGGAAVIYGAMYLVMGLFFSRGFLSLVHVFPMPVLGIVLLFEAIALMSLVRDATGERGGLWIALAVATCVIALPYGYLVGLVAGSLLTFSARKGWISLPGADPPS
jgi:MFS superfamily sulfate permease-like transporter